MLVLAHLTGWNISYELMTNIFLAIGIFVALIFQMRETLRSIGGYKMGWLPPTISLIVFSLTQWENWLWGWQIQVFLNVLAVVLGIIFLARAKFCWFYNFVAAILVFVATYSFVNGILYWPIGLSILYVASLNRKKKEKWLVIFWLMIGSMITLFYLHDHQTLGDKLTSWYSITHPFTYIIYVLSYLGSPVISFNPWGAAFAGIVGISLFCYLIKVLLYDRKIKPYHLIPYAAIGFYSIGSAILTGLGRVQLGSIQAISSRYVTFSNLLWISNIFFLYVLIKSDNLRLRAQHKSNRWKRQMLFSIYFLVIFLIGANSAFKALKFAYQYSYLQSARAALVTSKENSYLKRLYYSERVVRERSEILKKFNLSLFRDIRE